MAKKNRTKKDDDKPVEEKSTLHGELAYLKFIIDKPPTGLMINERLF